MDLGGSHQAQDHRQFCVSKDVILQCLILLTMEISCIKSFCQTLSSATCDNQLAMGYLVTKAQVQECRLVLEEYACKASMGRMNA